jgi:hypothetical protein
MESEKPVSQLVDKKAYMRKYMRDRTNRATVAINENEHLKKEIERLTRELELSQNKLRIVTAFATILKNQQTEIIQISRRDLDIFI